MKTNQLFITGLVLIFAHMPPVRCTASELEHIFSYELKMCDVDTISGARKYPDKRPSSIGFGKEWTATKKLPYKIGPGPIRIYIRTFPEQVDTTYTITIGDQSGSVTIPSDGYSQYHKAEIKLNLNKSSDLIKFHSSNENEQKARSIWYETFITNDPAWKYYENKRRGKVENKLKYDAPTTSIGTVNLLGNSGFEEGIRHWAFSTYKSNTAVKPLMLVDGKSAHGNYSINIGAKKIISDWIQLKPSKEYNVSFYFYVANIIPLVATIEYQTPDNKIKKLCDLRTDKSDEKVKQKWLRAEKTFSIPNSAITSGRIRISFEPSNITEHSILIDSVQIVANEKPLPYIPNNGLEANIISPRFQAIYNINEKANVVLNLYRQAEVRVETCKLYGYDYFDRKLWFREIQLSSDKQSISVVTELPTENAGLHRIVSEISYQVNGKKKLKYSQFLYNVIHPYVPLLGSEKSLFGGYYTNAPFGPLSYGESINQFGFMEFNSLGHHFMRWRSNVTRDSTKDNIKYNWENADHEVKGFLTTGINLTCNLHLTSAGSYGAPEWAITTNEEDGSKYYNIRGRQSKYVKVSRALWLDYVRTLVERYKGEINKYVIQDEPEYYFESLEDYARFYLDTREIVKSADPKARVFYNGFCYPWKFVKALSNVTAGEPERYMDGIHAYLSSQHAGKVSSTAEPEFRKWLNKFNIPLVTATCFSPANRLDCLLINDEDFSFLEQRNKELTSIHYFFDGIVWGGARCHYYYYGAMPGQDKGAYIFDSTGRIKPVFHYFSAANKLIGNFRKVESIDTYKDFRIGLVDKGNNRGLIIMYSVDGRIYDFNIPGEIAGKATDALGNTLSGNYCSPYPTFIETDNLALASKNLKQISFKEKISFDWTFSNSKQGLVLNLNLICDEDPKALTLIDSQSKDKKLIVKTLAAGKNRYCLEIPLYETASIAFKRKIKIPIATKWGDIYPEFNLDYQLEQKK